MTEPNPRLPVRPEDADRLIGMGEWTTAAGDEIIATIGLGPCIGVALYDYSSGQGFLAHTMGPETTTIKEMLAHIQKLGADPVSLSAWVSGGQPTLDPDGQLYQRQQRQQVLNLLTALGLREEQITAAWNTDPEGIADMVLDCGSGSCFIEQYDMQSLTDELGSILD